MAKRPLGPTLPGSRPEPATGRRLAAIVGGAVFTVVLIALVAFVAAGAQHDADVANGAAGLSLPTVSVSAPPTTYTFTKSGSVMRTPVDLMNQFAARFPFAAGYTITEIKLSDDGPWRVITPQTNISGLSGSVAVVIYYTDTTGRKRGAGFHPSGNEWSMAPQSGMQ